MRVATEILSLIRCNQLLVTEKYKNMILVDMGMVLISREDNQTLSISIV